MNHKELADEMGLKLRYVLATKYTKVPVREIYEYFKICATNKQRRNYLWYSDTTSYLTNTTKEFLWEHYIDTVPLH